MRKKVWARPELNKCKYYIKDPTELKGNWKSIFKNQNPLHVEFGCGKGSFISNLAFKNSNINYIGIDISDDVLGVARRNIEETFGDKEIDNIALTRFDIQYCSKIFDESDDIHKIYICFCNPWPRGKHHKRRLTHSRQLVQYKEFLNYNGEIYFKTDHDQLFADSQRYLKDNGFKIKCITHDLYNSEFLKNNLPTKHEIMFNEMGIPIKFLIAKIT